MVSLGAQALAPLGSTAIDQQATVFGGHAGAEAVVALALEYAGLKGSFHDDISASSSGPVEDRKMRANSS